jgi:hypothetical protein
MPGTELVVLPDAASGGEISVRVNKTNILQKA